MLKWDFSLLGQRMSEGYRTFGPGMMAYFIKATMIDRQIPAYINTGVQELVTDNGAVIGVRAEKDGKDFWVAAHKGVLLCMIDSLCSR